MRLLTVGVTLGPASAWRSRPTDHKDKSNHYYCRKLFLFHQPIPIIDLKCLLMACCPPTGITL